MSADSEALITLTLTRAEFERLPDGIKKAALISTAKSTNRFAGKRGTVIANQGPHQQAEEQMQEQQKEEQLQELLASFSPEKVYQLLTRIGLWREADSEVNQSKDKAAQLERPGGADSNEINQLKDKVAQLEQLQAKKQDKNDEQFRRLLAERDEKNKRLQAEVERLKNVAEKNAKLGEGVPSPAVPASNDPVQAPESNASRDPGKDHDEADADLLLVSTAAPSTANSEPAGSSGTSSASASSRSPPSEGQSLADTRAASDGDPEHSSSSLSQDVGHLTGNLDIASENPFQDVHSASSVDMPNDASESPSQDDAGPPGSLDVDMPDAADAASASSNPGVQSPSSSAINRPSSLPSQVDAASQIQPTSVPPPLSHQGNDNHKGVKHQWMLCDHSKILVLDPTPEQYQDLKGAKVSPLLFDIAEELGARAQGAFIINIPKECRSVLPKQTTRKLDCTIYHPEELESGFWRVCTGKGRRQFSWLDVDPSKANLSTRAAIQQFQDHLQKGLADVAYKTDAPALIPRDREQACLPEESTIWPIPGKLPKNGGVVGLHSPTAYTGTAWAPFGWHVEDFFLWALNCLYWGVKIWHIIPPENREAATAAFAGFLGSNPDHDQFLRHEALHGGFEYFQDKDIPTISFPQHSWQIVVTYPGVYHSGFSVTETRAEAINYAHPTDATPKGYKPCTQECNGLPPITYDLVFEAAPNGNKKTIPGDKVSERIATLRRREPRQVGTLRPASAKDPTGYPRSPQTKKRSARGLEGEQDESQDERPAKQKNTTPSPQAIAEELTSQQAKERIRRYTELWKERHSSCPLETLANRQPQPDDATPEAYKYFHLGWHFEEKADISRIVGVLLKAHGLKKVYDDVPGGMYDKHGKVIKLPREVIDNLKAGFRETPTPSIWSTEMKRQRKFLKIGVDWVPLMSCGGSNAALGHIERLSDEEVREVHTILDRDPKAKSFASMGKEFRTMILKTHDHKGEDATRIIDQVLELL
ncbi:hypothetical protein RB596_000198 [Gaeumannomyces avenae]